MLSLLVKGRVFFTRLRVLVGDRGLILAWGRCMLETVRVFIAKVVQGNVACLV